MNKKIYAVIAGLLVVVLVGSAFFFLKDRVYARETLLGIEHIREKAMSEEGKPFRILEIVPEEGLASSLMTDAGEQPAVKVTTRYDADGNKVVSESGSESERTIFLVNNADNGRKDATYSTGTFGFYVKGQEPVFQDMVRVFSDQEGAPSLLTDSVARKNFANAAMFGTSGTPQQIAYLVTDFSNASGVFYKNDIAGYRELRLGEKIGQDINGDGNAEQYATEELMNALEKSGLYFAIGHEYQGENGYIDLAEGTMTRASEEEMGNYSRRYLPDLTKRSTAADPSVTETVLDKTKDPAYKELTSWESSVNTTGAIANPLFASAVDRDTGISTGTFDPYFVHVDNNIGASGSEKRRATFSYMQGVSSGYYITASNLLDPDVDSGVAKGTPVYTFNEEANSYEFVGFFEKWTTSESGNLPVLKPMSSDTTVNGSPDTEYYSLKFQYSAEPQGISGFYQVSYFDKGKSDGSGSYTGAEYVLNDTVEGALVPNEKGTGIVDVNPSAYTADSHFLYEYTPGQGLFQWTSDSWLQDDTGKKPYRIKGAKIYFTSGLVNRDKFKREVFDLEPEQYDSFPVIVETRAAKDVTVEDIQTASCVIMHKGNDMFCLGQTPLTYKKDSRDISLAVCKAIVDGVLNRGLPVINQHNMLLEIGGASKEANALDAYNGPENPLPGDTPYIYYLSRTLTLKNMEQYYNQVLQPATEGAPIDSPLRSGEVVSAGTVNGQANHVNGSVYNVTLSNNDPTLGLLCVNFTDVVSNASGYQPVLQNIQAENVYRVANHLSGRLEEKISMATIIRYIIAYADSQNYDSNGSLHILELAPCASYTLHLETTGEGDDQKTILYQITEKNANGEVIGKKELISYDKADITLTQMTTAEFIGKVEDINAHYDMVYIGSDIGPYQLPNGKIVKLCQDDEGKTVYNDSDMNGLIYTNVGDTFAVTQIGYENANETARFSGNDITEEKKNALLQFIQAGFPVVVSDELVNTNPGAVIEEGKRSPLTVNADTVDNCSYLYQFLEESRERENFIRLSELSAPLLNMYFSISRPMLRMVEGTLGADSQNEVQRLQNHNDGYCRAVFEFVIDSPGIGGNDSDYDFELYIDANADGKFSKTTECITQFEMTDSSGNQIAREDGRYRLESGKAYRATYLISSSQRGVLPWKIVVIKNDDIHLKRADAMGYYEIRDPNGTLEKITVLQIDTYSGNTGNVSSTWNMEETLEKPETVFYQLMNDHEMVPFDVSIDTVPSDKLTVADILEKKGNGTLSVENVLSDANQNGTLEVEEYLDFFRSYDMLVLGFANCYSAPTEKAIDAIKMYIEEGRSVLFTHDSTSPYSIAGEGWMHYCNVLLRDSLGMDRFNITGQRQFGEEETFTREQVYKPKSDNEDIQVGYGQGHTYSVMIRKSAADRQYMIQEGLQNAKADYPFDQTQYQTASVDPVNRGQITMYPYKLEQESFKVASTHGQYWQLDFTKDDDRDGESDLVVWYTLGGTDLYGLSPRDVRNNYYIYNKGNVTYSGVGDSDVMNAQGEANGTDNEIKLFINTLIAAYESGLHAPSVRIIENYETTSRDLNSIYLSYDDQIRALANQDDGIIDTTENIYFVATSNSLIRNGQGKTKLFTANLYMEVPEESGAEKLICKGSVLYGRPLAVEGLFYLDAGGVEQQVTPYEDGSYPIEPGVVYKARVSVSALRYYNNAQDVYDEREGQATEQEIGGARNAKKIMVTATETVRVNASGNETKASAVDQVDFVRVQLFDLD